MAQTMAEAQTQIYNTVLAGRAETLRSAAQTLEDHSDIYTDPETCIAFLRNFARILEEQKW